MSDTRRRFDKNEQYEIKDPNCPNEQRKRKQRKSDNYDEIESDEESGYIERY